MTHGEHMTHDTKLTNHKSHCKENEQGRAKERRNLRDGANTTGCCCRCGI